MTSTPAKLLGIGLVSATALSGCATFGESDADGAVTMSGSSTIGPIAIIASREANLDTSVETVGTNDGFAAFCEGEVDINNASAPIVGSEAEEDFQQLCAENGVEYIELAIGIDAITMVHNTETDFVDDLSLEELAALWEAESEVQTWADLRGDWPEDEIVLFGRDAASGTFTVFTQEVLGSPDAIRDDYENTDDLDELAHWVAEEPNGLAFMGIGNYLSADEDDRNRITTLTVDGISPDAVNSASGSYPLARELYIYVSVDSLEENDSVEEYVTFLLENGRSILPRAFFYPLDESAYDEQLQKLEDRVTGADAAS